MKKIPEKQTADLYSDLQNHIEENQLIWARGFITSLISVIITLALLFIIGFFLKFIPNDIDMEKIKSVYYVPFNSFWPEAPERARYIVTTVLFPVLFVIFYLFASKLKIQRSHILFAGYIFPVILFFEILVFFIECLCRRILSINSRLKMSFSCR